MKILVIDDNASLARALDTFLTQENHDAVTAGSVKEAFAAIAVNDFDLVLTDLKLPDGDGLQIIRHVRANCSSCSPEIILMTAFGSIDSAVEAMRLGVADYLTKPVSLEEFAFRIQKIERFRRLGQEKKQLEIERERLLAAAGLDTSLEDIAGSSPLIQDVRNMILRVAAYPSTVLVTGETGVGKEMVAKAVHRCSQRRDKPFIRVNCASIPENLFEAELFGYEKGAFTDAKQRRIGSFETADGGTLFLDEIGEIPLVLQAKLLRALQEKEIHRLGSSRPIKIDVRIVAATNRNLEKMVDEKLFREDLLYRLSVFNIHVPPLRMRLEDLPVICQKLLQRLSGDLGKGPLRLTEKALDTLAGMKWPGNIRQLRNYLERAAVMSDQLILDSLESDRNESAGGKNDCVRGADSHKTAEDQIEASLPDALEAQEKKMKTAALEKSGKIKTRAAEILGIPRTQLLYRMKRLGLDCAEDA
jgi:DNA-binding NtrC family response regulator